MHTNKKASIRTAISANAITAAIALFGVSISVQVSALDLQSRHRFKIPSESLNAALTVLSAQTRIHVVTSRVPAGTLSPGVSGDLSAVNALTALLRGTGMSFRQVDAETIVVAPAKTAATLYPAQFLLLGDVDQNALADQPAAAATPATTETGLQEVTVSASAISIAGYDQPTPVTSIGIGRLEGAAQTDITDALRQLPAFGASSSPQNTTQSQEISNGQQGLDQVNLRNLSTQSSGNGRTLVLLDGQRVVNGSIYGGADTSWIPSTLIERVDVVTGGASAIWGSDAVAGVVNFILNRNFNGALVNIEGSNDIPQASHFQVKADIALGTGFDDDRGHIEVAGSWLRAPDTFWSSQVEGFAYQRLVNNPAYASGCGCPEYIRANNVGGATATPGGLIVSGLNGQSIPLDNTYFVGPQATPSVFDPGNVSKGGFYSYGGTPNTLYGDNSADGLPFGNQTAFGLLSFKLSDTVTASLQLDYGYDSFLGDSYPDAQLGTAAIYSGNPYIPASIQAEMTALGIPGFKLGTQNVNPFVGGYPPMGSLIDTVSDTVIFESRRLMRGVFTLDGKIGENWAWNAYFESSETHQFETLLNNAIKANLLDAENAVTVGSYSANYTAANYPNPLGLPLGTATCLSNLLPKGARGETTNCAPLDVFGTGPGIASPAALNYIDGVARAGGDAEHINLYENAVQATVQGKLPFGTSAGPVAAAVDLVYRDERANTINCGIDCTDVDFYLGNFANLYGDFYTREASAELNAPLLKDQGVRSLSVDAAYRAVDYSTSGFVSVYKFGLVSQLTDPVRLRVSYSRDIRAPGMEELFTQPTPIAGSTIDPRTGVTVETYGVTQGNPNLLPEDSETRTAGFVLTPVQGLTTSLDWYYIRIKNAITSALPTNSVQNFCEAGVASFCEDLVWGKYPNGCTGPSITSCPGEPLAATIRAPFNAASWITSGLDWLGDYRTPFMQGALDVNLDMNYMFNETITAPVAPGVSSTFDYAGSLGADAMYYFGVPKFRGTIGATYTQGGWLGTIQTRLIGAAALDTAFGPSILSPQDNAVPFVAYLDLRLSYKWSDGVQLYGAIDNVLNRYPPAIPNTAAAIGLYTSPFRDDIYDGYGVVWRVGVRLRFGG